MGGISISRPWQFTSGVFGQGITLVNNENELEKAISQFKNGKYILQAWFTYCWSNNAYVSRKLSLGRSSPSSISLHATAKLSPRRACLTARRSRRYSLQGSSMTLSPQTRCLARPSIRSPLCLTSPGASLLAHQTTVDSVALTSSLARVKCHSRSLIKCFHPYPP